MEGWFNKLVNVATLIVILIGFVTLCFILIKWNSSYPEPSASYHFNIKVIQVKSDDNLSSSKDFLLINKKYLDSLNSNVNRLNKNANYIQKLKDDMIKIRNEEGFFSKTSASIIALIIAVASFFGFKSVVDIKKENLSQSTQAAERIAREVATSSASSAINLFTNEAEANIKKELRATVSTEIDDNLLGVQSELIRLSKMIDVLQNPSAFVSQSSNQNLGETETGSGTSEPKNELFGDE